MYLNYISNNKHSLRPKSSGVNRLELQGERLRSERLGVVAQRSAAARVAAVLPVEVKGAERA